MIALDPKTGEKRWRDQSPDPGVRRVLGEGKELVFAYETPCARAAGATPVASLIAFDRASGDERWRRPIRVVANTQAQFAVGGATIVVLGRDGRLQGLDPSSGEIQWKAALQGLLPAAGSADVVILTSQPDVADPQTVYAPGQLRALDRKTGDALWSYQTDEFGPLTQVDAATVGSDTAIIAFRGLTRTRPDSAGAQLGFDLRTGNQLWQVPLTDSSLETRSGWGLMFESSLGAPLAAYDARTREQQWVAATPTEGVAEMAGDLVLSVVSSPQPKWVALDAANGNVLWESVRNGSAVALGRGTVIDADEGVRGHMTALDSRSGDAKWTKRLPPGGGKAWRSARNVYVSGGCLAVDQT